MSTKSVDGNRSALSDGRADKAQYIVKIVSIRKICLYCHICKKYFKSYPSMTQRKASTYHDDKQRCDGVMHTQTASP